MNSEHLPPNAHQLFSAAMAWLDARWDERDGLRFDPARSYRGNTSEPAPHYTRETAFYALGLFMRGDPQKASLALEQVLRCQTNDRDKDYTGAFLRHPEEPPPPGRSAREWKDFNPNWREYIGITLAIILSEFSEHLSPELFKRTDTALRKCTAGALWRRIPPEYTHIGMFKAFLLAFTGVRYGLEAWLEGGEMQGTEIFRVFNSHKCFPNFNSPGDYGMILLGAGLWGKYAPSTKMRSMADEMEEALWKQIAQFYHADMGNLAGPYERAFGMDMRQYASPLGLCIWASVGQEHAPCPDLAGSFAQEHEIASAIPLLAVGVACPEKLRHELEAFRMERHLHQVISGPAPEALAGQPSAPAQHFIASAWLDKAIMLGALGWGGGDLPPVKNPNRPIAAPFASYPATVHWMAGENQLGWICAELPADASASAGPKILSIECLPTETTGGEDWSILFRFHSPSLPIFALDKWTFPGLTVHLHSNLAFSAPTQRGDLFEIECRRTAATGQEARAYINLNFQP
jgi:hypothetical protein